MIVMAARCKYGHTAGRYTTDKSCVTCRRTRAKDTYDYTPRPVFLLWEDAEYQFLREQGLTPREIGDKHGIKWESFQRTLYRRVGLKEKW